jgi:outer membrane protein
MKSLSIAFGLIAALFGGAALAQENTLDLGVVNFQINSSSPDISGRYTPGGLNLDVGNATSLYLAYTRHVWGHFSAELDGGIPPKFNVYAKGPATVGSVPYNGVTLASAHSFTPAAFVNYNFLDTSNPWQPYIGLGVNYTNFYKISSTSGNNAINGGYTMLGLSDSWGVAGHVGLRYRIQDHWSVNFAVTMADVKSNLTTDTYGVRRGTTIDFRPTVFILSVGYSY